MQPLSMDNLPSIPTLPPEIIDIITDFLFDDKPALANMTLVCKAFLPSARLHLFETLTIEMEQLCEPAQLKPRVLEIIDVFTSFASLVRHLRLRLSWDARVDWNLEFANWIRVFLPCLSVLKGVTTLSLPDFCWESPVEARNELFARFSGILEFRIEGGYFPDAAAIVMSALQFPLLERLHLDDIDWVENSLSYKHIPNVVQAFSNLTSLTIECLNMMSILYQSLFLEMTPSLHSLHITTLALYELEPAGRFIRALAPTLRHLTLAFESGGPISSSFCGGVY
jgi:hypothetical protein